MENKAQTKANLCIFNININNGSVHIIKEIFG